MVETTNEYAPPARELQRPSTCLETKPLGFVQYGITSSAAKERPLHLYPYDWHAMYHIIVSYLIQEVPSGNISLM